MQDLHVAWDHCFIYDFWFFFFFNRLHSKMEILLRTCNRTMPEENGGGWDLRSETAVISLSVAAPGDVTVVRVLVSTVPSGTLWSASHPFMDNEQSRNLCFIQKVSSNYDLLRKKTALKNRKKKKNRVLAESDWNKQTWRETREDSLVNEAGE